MNKFTIFILTVLIATVHTTAPSYNEIFTVDELTPERQSESSAKTSIFQKKDLYTLEYEYKMTKFSQMANLLHEFDALNIKFKLEVSFALGTIHQNKYREMNLNSDINNSGSFFALRIQKSEDLTLAKA